MLSRYFAMHLSSCAPANSAGPTRLYSRAALLSCHTSTAPVKPPPPSTSMTCPRNTPANRIKKDAIGVHPPPAVPPLVEMRGLEPLTCALQRHRSPG